jgi:creatinine amidohydrolase
MKLSSMNWMQVESYLRSDDRVVLPLGTTQQHAYLSLATDAYLAVRIAEDAAQPLGVPVCPVLSYGLSPAFMAYPGTITLRPKTYALVLAELLDSLIESGFRRILIVNGHRGNTPAAEVAAAWSSGRPGIQLIFHNWWSAPRTASRIHAIDPVAGHGSWVENFPWTRLSNAPAPDDLKPESTFDLHAEIGPTRVRRMLGDGSMGGYYERDDGEMMQLWAVMVQETRAVLECGWSQVIEETHDHRVVQIPRQLPSL